MSMQYCCRFVAERRSIDLVEISTNETERIVRVTTGGSPSWEIALPIWCPPSVAIFSDTFAVWAATRLFLLIPGEEAVRADFDDEVHAVYAVEGKFCIVAELSVFVYDAQRGAIVDNFQADDILGNSWWEGERLFVESVSGKPHSFVPSAAGLKPVTTP